MSEGVQGVPLLERYVATLRIPTKEMHIRWQISASVVFRRPMRRLANNGGRRQSGAHLDSFPPVLYPAGCPKQNTDCVCAHGLMDHSSRDLYNMVSIAKSIGLAAKETHTIPFP